MSERLTDPVIGDCNQQFDASMFNRNLYAARPASVVVNTFTAISLAACSVGPSATPKGFKKSESGTSTISAPTQEPVQVAPTLNVLPSVVANEGSRPQPPKEPVASPIPEPKQSPTPDQTVSPYPKDDSNFLPFTEADNALAEAEVRVVAGNAFVDSVLERSSTEFKKNGVYQKVKPQFIAVRNGETGEVVGYGIFQFNPVNGQYIGIEYKDPESGEIKYFVNFAEAFIEIGNGTYSINSIQTPLGFGGKVRQAIVGTESGHTVVALTDENYEQRLAWFHEGQGKWKYSTSFTPPEVARVELDETHNTYKGFNEQGSLIRVFNSETFLWEKIYSSWNVEELLEDVKNGYLERPENKARLEVLIAQGGGNSGKTDWELMMGDIPNHKGYKSDIGWFTSGTMTETALVVGSGDISLGQPRFGTEYSPFDYLKVIYAVNPREPNTLIPVIYAQVVNGNMKILPFLSQDRSVNPFTEIRDGVKSEADLSAEIAQMDIVTIGLKVVYPKPEYEGPNSGPDYSGYLRRLQQYNDLMSIPGAADGYIARFTKNPEDYFSYKLPRNPKDPPGKTYYVPTTFQELLGKLDELDVAGLYADMLHEVSNN